MLKLLIWFFSRLALFATTILLVIFAWFADANLVNAAFDANQWIAERVAALLDESGRLKTAFRFINMERVLLFTEIMAVLFALAVYVRAIVQRAYARMRQERLAQLAKPMPAEAKTAGERGSNEKAGYHGR
jgi:hypothetical protein